MSDTHEWMEKSEDEMMIHYRCSRCGMQISRCHDTAALIRWSTGGDPTGLMDPLRDSCDMAILREVMGS